LRPYRHTCGCGGPVTTVCAARWQMATRTRRTLSSSASSCPTRRRMWSPPSTSSCTLPSLMWLEARTTSPLRWRRRACRTSRSVGCWRLYSSPVGRVGRHAHRVSAWSAPCRSCGLQTRARVFVCVSAVWLRSCSCASRTSTGWSRPPSWSPCGRSRRPCLRPRPRTPGRARMMCVPVRRWPRAVRLPLHGSLPCVDCVASRALIFA
jgi:hypothetical protein